MTKIPDERKDFMKGKNSMRIYPNPHIVVLSDPLKKREDFAVSLRKIKRDEIMKKKRMW